MYSTYCKSIDIFLFRKNSSFEIIGDRSCELCKHNPCMRTQTTSLSSHSSLQLDIEVGGGVSPLDHYCRNAFASTPVLAFKLESENDSLVRRPTTVPPSVPPTTTIQRNPNKVKRLYAFESGKSSGTE